MEAKEIDYEVVDLRSLSALSTDTVVDSLEITGRVVVVPGVERNDSEVG